VVPTAGGGDWPLIIDLARYCAAEKLALKDVIVNLKFELLR